MSRIDIEQAAVRFNNGRAPGFIRETPLWKLPGSVVGIECNEVWLKLEHTQTAGSF